MDSKIASPENISSRLSSSSSSSETFLASTNDDGENILKPERERPILLSPNDDSPIPFDCHGLPVVVYASDDKRRDYDYRFGICKKYITSSSWSKRSLTVPICPVCVSFFPKTTSNMRRCQSCTNTIRWQCKLCGIVCWDGGANSYSAHLNHMLKGSTVDVDHEPLRAFIRDNLTFKPLERRLLNDEKIEGGITRSKLKKRKKRAASPLLDSDEDIYDSKKRKSISVEAFSHPSFKLKIKTSGLKSPQPPLSLFSTVNNRFSTKNLIGPEEMQNMEHSMSSAQNYVCEDQTERESLSASEYLNAGLTLFSIKGDTPSSSPNSTSSRTPALSRNQLNIKSFQNIASSLGALSNASTANSSCSTLLQQNQEAPTNNHLKKYNIAEYLKDMQENLNSAHEKLHQTDHQNLELKVENSVLKGERDAFFALVTVLENDAKEKFESIKNLPKLYEKIHDLESHVKQLSAKLEQTENELQNYKKISHTTYYPQNSVQPCYFATFDELNNDLSRFNQIAKFAQQKIDVGADLMDTASISSPDLEVSSSSLVYKQCTRFDMIGAHPSISRLITTTKTKSNQPAVVVEYVHGISCGLFLRILNIFRRMNVSKNKCSVHSLLEKLNITSSSSTSPIENLISSMEKNGGVCSSQDIEDIKELYEKYPDLNSFAGWSLDLITQLTDGVLFIHNQNLVHRDLHCENIIIEPDFEEYFGSGLWNPTRLVVVGFGRMGSKLDWGSLKKFTNDYDSRPLHMAPENFTSCTEEVKEKVDVYSLGVLFKDLWENGVFNACDGNDKAPEFISGMCSMNPALRPTLDKVLDLLEKRL